MYLMKLDEKDLESILSKFELDRRIHYAKNYFLLESNYPLIFKEIENMCHSQIEKNELCFELDLEEMEFLFALKRFDLSNLFRLVDNLNADSHLLSFVNYLPNEFISIFEDNKYACSCGHSTFFGKFVDKINKFSKSENYELYNPINTNSKLKKINKSYQDELNTINKDQVYYTLDNFFLENNLLSDLLKPKFLHSKPIDIETYLKSEQFKSLQGSEFYELFKKSQILVDERHHDLNLLYSFYDKIDSYLEDITKFYFNEFFSSFLNIGNMIPIKDKEYRFIRSFLTSNIVDNYSSISDLESDIETLIKLNYKPFDKFKSILDYGAITNLSELIDCASISLDNYEVVKKLVSGGWSDNYLVYSELSTDELPIKRFLKIVDKKTKGNSSMDSLVEKLGGIEATIEKFTHEENYVNLVTLSKKRVSPNFGYTPLPAFCGLQKLMVNDVETSGLLYDFIEGETLDKSFKKANSLDEQLSLLSKAAYSLNYLHQKKFTHNDIKPDNFMVDLDADVLILDLAFSRIAESYSSILGSRTYTAPERIIGGQKPTEKADQYSFGIMVYELLTGKPPLTYELANGNREEFSRLVYEKKITPKNILDVRSGLNPKLAEIVMKCISYDPKDRYVSMQEVENELIALSKVIK